MTTCHHCGQDIPEKVQWRALTVTSADEVFWRGLRIRGINTTPARILFALARTGTASHLALAMLAASGESVTVHVSKLRRALRLAEVPIVIRAEHGRGYRLEAISDA
jgi:hypothetical protein